MMFNRDNNSPYALIVNFNFSSAQISTQFSPCMFFFTLVVIATCTSTWILNMTIATTKLIVLIVPTMPYGRLGRKPIEVEADKKLIVTF